jgi:quinol monooxygenase YgiN
MQAVNAQLREPVQLRLYRPASQPMPGEGNVDRTLVEAQPPAIPTAAKTGERLAAAGLSGAPFALLVDVPVKPGGAALMKDTAVRVQAATLQEAACIRYGYFQDVETPDAFLLFEWWQHFEGMAAHVELPHFQELMRTFGAIGGQGRTVGIYKPLPF